MSNDDALNIHVEFFDRNRDGQITRQEIQKALRELGFSRLVAAAVAPALALGLPGDVDAARALRHDDSGAFDRDGRFDEGAFVDWWERSDTDGSGDLSRWELLLGSVRLADDPVSLVASVGEFQLLHLLLAEDGRLNRLAVEGFLSGALFRKIIDQREETS